MPIGKRRGRARRGRRGSRRSWTVEVIRRGYEWVSLPFLTVFLLHGRQVHPGYRLTWRRKFRLARRMYRNTKRVETGTSHRAHLAMAAKIFEVAPDQEGVIVEAGCWKGGTTANLSLVADIVGRDLVVYDSFEGLPAPAEGDRWASPLGRGAFRGDLDEVRANVARCGVVERCRFRKGWFSDTLGDHTEPIVAAFLDVDHQASIHQCILGLWPHLIDRGYLFVDEYVRLDYCALFFSERFWRTYFDRPPPGLMGAGTGVPVGQHFLGPYRSRPPLQEPNSIGWTRKDFYGEWDYAPDDIPASPLTGGPGASHGPDGWTTTTRSADERTEPVLGKVLMSSDAGRERLVAKIMEGDAGRDRLEAALGSDEGQRAFGEALLATDEGQERLVAELLASDAGRERLDAALRGTDEDQQVFAVLLANEERRERIARALAEAPAAESPGSPEGSGAPERA